MGISFHCEHCGRGVQAPTDAGGRRGKCPHCEGKVYIPLPEDEVKGDLPLTPLDPADEARRREALREAATLQRALLQERSVPGEPGPRRRTRGTGAPDVPAAIPSKDLNRMVVEYVEAMAGGRLDRAEALSARLAKHRSQVITTLNAMTTEALAGYGLPALPRPVLLGFLKQLRAELQGRAG